MSESISETVEATAPELVGTWTFDPFDPAGTSRQFLFTRDREEKLAVDATELRFIGRARPVVEFGEAEDIRLGLTVFLPFGPEHDPGVAYWRAALKARRALCYRDNRGRLEYVALGDGLSLVDAREGTGVGMSLVVVDYDESVA